jgi:hypothetical protein
MRRLVSTAIENVSPIYWQTEEAQNLLFMYAFNDILRTQGGQDSPDGGIEMEAPRDPRTVAVCGGDHAYRS